MDFSHDEFASFFIGFFPRRVEVRPGDSVVFKQTWTGEPHTVTLGSLVDDMMKVAWPYLDMLERLEPLPDAPPGDLLEKMQKVPEAWGDEDSLIQTAMQPCYMGEEQPPMDGSPCTQQEQRPFTGKETYYNSGFIPYEGAQGNTFTLPLSEDLDPGQYYFYCAVHGVLQGGMLDVKPPSTPIPTQAEVNRQARKEIQAWAVPLAETYREAQRDNILRFRGDTFRGPFAGLANEKVEHAGINEFVPRTIRTRVGRPVSWRFFGSAHTVSFNVPEYFPIVQVGDDGNVALNPLLSEPQGGSP
ncbi:MAG TPA: hypothetical protein VM840_08265, partial [Actinomycetota bacterium]|nr:hypothetical protein [Actinomycetota bacterium]